MGFFGKIKENLHHGGVQVSFQAPDKISVNDPVLPVTVTITATDQPVTVNKVTARIDATSQNMGFSQPSGTNNMNMNQPQSTTQIVAQQVYAQPFTLNPGQSQTLQISIAISPQGQGPEAQVAQALQTVAKGLSLLRGTSYFYSLVVSADVDGISLDPHATKTLHISGGNEAIGLHHEF